MNEQHEQTAALAYSLWQQRGCPVGSADFDWLEAEQRLSSIAVGGNSLDAAPVVVVPAITAAAAAGDETTLDDTLLGDTDLGNDKAMFNTVKLDGPLEDTFPASDPPATHVPDEPPVNAEEKWHAA